MSSVLTIKTSLKLTAQALCLTFGVQSHHVICNSFYWRKWRKLHRWPGWNPIMPLGVGGARASILQFWSKEEQQCSLLRAQTHVYVWKVVMGFREGVLLGTVLLLSCGELCAATRSWFNTNNNETLNQIPKERAATSSPQTTEQHTNQTEQRHLVHSPVTYQLRSYQLRNPALSRTTTVQPLVEQTQTFQSRELALEQLESRETDLPQHVNSPFKQESKVL